MQFLIIEYIKYLTASNYNNILLLWQNIVLPVKAVMIAIVVW